MNNLLNIKRLGLNFRKDLLENGKRYLLLYLTMLGIMTIILTWMSWENYTIRTRHGLVDIRHINQNLLMTACFFFAGFGVLFASTFSQPINSKIRRISYLVYPASNLEKFLTRWLLLTVGYVIAFFTALWLADMVRTGICAARFPKQEVSFLDLTKLVYTGEKTWNHQAGYLFNKPVFFIVVSAYFFFQSLFILGATFWEKASFVKTFTAGAFIVLVFALVYRSIILLCYGDFGHLGHVIESFLDPIERTEVNRELMCAIIALIISLFTLGNWTLSFFRFRESEITKRL